MEKPEHLQLKEQESESVSEKSQEKSQESEEEEVEEVGLRGRLPINHFSSSTTTTTTTSSTTTTTTYASGNGENGAGSEEQHQQIVVVEEEQEDLQNGSVEEQEDTNSTGFNSEIKQLNGHHTSEKNIYYDQDDGAKSVQGFIGEERGGDLCSDSERDVNLLDMGKLCENGNGLSTVTNRQYKDIIENNILSDFGYLPSSEETNASQKTCNTEAVKDVDLNVVKEVDQEETDYDVERVLEQQETHDLFCPNCNSCITKRVILRKRKRKIKIIGEEAKRNRSEIVVESRLDAIPGNATYYQGPETVDITATGASDINHDREPDVFRCLSCFSFFIPKRKHWFSFIFPSSRQEPSLQQGSQQTAVVGRSEVGATIPPVNLNNQSGQAPSSQDSSSTTSVSIGVHEKSDIKESRVVGNNIVSTSTRGTELVTNVTVDVRGKLDDATFVGTAAGGAMPGQSEITIVNQINSSSSSSKLPRDHEINNSVAQLTGRTPINNGEEAENASLIPQQNGFKLRVPSEVDSLVLDMSKTDQRIVEKRNEASGESDMDGKASISSGGNDHNAGSSFSFESVTKEENTNFRKSDKDGAYQYEVSQHTVTETKVNFYTEEPFNAEAHALSPSKQDVLLLEDSYNNTINGLKEMPAESKSGDVVKETRILVEERPVDLAAPERVNNFVSSPHTEVQIQSSVQNVTETREVYSIEIIKSIVYGGLMESITSLGVVSSAAGADAATLNILALGLASMIGGLFIIGHNIADLREDDSRVAYNGVTARVDRYQEQLGRRKNFLLHVILAILSFIIFGLLPPVIYGFSYRKTDNRDFKLVAVAGASLLCIIALATAKAYVERPPKSYVKMVSYYVVMGFLASGVSYVAGDLINKLVENLGWFEQSSVVTVLPLLPKTSIEHHPWQSY